MSVSPAFRYIRCDGPHCGQVFEVDGADRSVHEQRRWFSQSGWHHWGNLDLCHECWPNRANLIREAQR